MSIECSLSNRGDMCMPSHTFKKICDSLSVPDRDLSAVKEYLGVKYEYQILTHPRVRDIIDEHETQEYLLTKYKPIGSWVPEPLTNTQIDQSIEQWEQMKSPESCRELLNLEINMIDFAKYGGTLEQLIDALPDVVGGKPTKFVMPETGRARVISNARRVFSCVLNSDSLGGPGKHWTAIYIDLRGPRGTIEFFNSSGNSPYPEIIAWQSRLIRRIIDLKICESVSFVSVSNIKHQRGPSECGVYCLYYIWSRLHGTSYEHFKRVEIRDEQVTEFRRTHLFLPQ